MGYHTWYPGEVNRMRRDVLIYTIAAKFRISGDLRFLSHQETMRLFQRALVRTFHSSKGYLQADEACDSGGINLSYSKGYNPRPRISLPLPRSVGLEGDAELLCVLIETDENSETRESRFIGIDAEQIRNRVERQLPWGCFLISLDLIKGKARFHPAAAVYEFELARSEQLPKAQIEKIRLKAGSRCIGNEHIFIERRINEKGDTREVDVGGYIESIEVNGLKIIVRCTITPSGTIRVDEIMKLLGVNESMITGGAKRTSIKWNTTTS
jgi:hypothetical protein